MQAVTWHGTYVLLEINIDLNEQFYYYTICMHACGFPEQISVKKIVQLNVSSMQIDRISEHFH